MTVTGTQVRTLVHSKARMGCMMKPDTRVSGHYWRGSLTDRSRVQNKTAAGRVDFHVPQRAFGNELTKLVAYRVVRRRSTPRPARPRPISRKLAGSGAAPVRVEPLERRPDQPAPPIPGAAS